MKAPKNFAQKINEQILQTSRGKAMLKLFSVSGNGVPDDKFWVMEHEMVFGGNCLLFEIDWNDFSLKITRCRNGEGTSGVLITEKTFTKRDCLSLQNFMIMIKDEIETHIKQYTI